MLRMLADELQSLDADPQFKRQGETKRSQDRHKFIADNIKTEYQSSLADSDPFTD